MKIINHPSIIRASTVEFDEHTLPHRVVLRREGEKFIVHNEVLELVLEPHVMFVHRDFSNGAYFSDLEAAEACFVGR